MDIVIPVLSAYQLVCIFHVDEDNEESSDDETMGDFTKRDGQTYFFSGEPLYQASMTVITMISYT